MNTFINIRDPRRQNIWQTRKQFSDLIELFEIGIALLVESTAILETESDSLDRNTPEGASKFAAWRFMSTLPISATWCFDIAQSGDYPIAKNILRLTLEETVKLAFYVTYPQSALRQIVQDRGSDEIKLSEMLEQLDLEHRKGLLRLFGNISNLYSHANLNLPPELCYQENGKNTIGGGSRFIPESFQAIIHQLLILIGNALKYILLRFPNLYEREDWKRKFVYFMETSVSLIKSIKDEE